jgi:hypothetical protein
VGDSTTLMARPFHLKLGLHQSLAHLHEFNAIAKWV